MRLKITLSTCSTDTVSRLRKTGLNLERPTLIRGQWISAWSLCTNWTLLHFVSHLLFTLLTLRQIKNIWFDERLRIQEIDLQITSLVCEPSKSTKNWVLSQYRFIARFNQYCASWCTVTSWKVATMMGKGLPRSVGGEYLLEAAAPVGHCYTLSRASPNVHSVVSLNYQGGDWVQVFSPA